MRRATLGLVIEREQVGAASRALDDMGTRGEAAARRIRDSMSATDRAILKTAESMRRMQETSRANAMASMIQAADPFQQTAAGAEKLAAATTKSHLSLGMLSKELMTASRNMLGVNPIIAQLSGVLGNFAIGAAWMVGILAGVAALAHLWDKVSEAARKAKEEQAGARVTLEAVREKGRNPVLGGLPHAVALEQDHLMELETQFKKAQEMARVYGERRFIAEAQRLNNEITNSKNLIQWGQKEIERLNAEHKDELARKAKEAADKEIAEIERIRKARRDLMAYEGGLIDDKVNLNTIPGFGMAKDNSGRDAALQRVLTIQMPNSVLEAVRIAAITAKVIDSAAEKQKAALKQIAGGAALSLLSQTGAGGSAASGIISAGMAGASAGPFGVATAGAAAFASQLLSSGAAARAAAEQMRRLNESLEENLAAQEALVGSGTSLEVDLIRVKRQFQEMRDQLNGSNPVLFALAMGLKVSAETMDAYLEKLHRINAAEKKRVEQLEEEEKKRAAEKIEEERRREAELIRKQKEALEDLNVRRMTALGYDADQIEAMKIALANQREYEQAVRDGASATYLAQLAEVQKAEAVARAIEKVKGTIAGLTATIDGLQSFKNSLRLSDAFAGTPTEKLAEARRQYEEILKQAMGGDAGAAGRLPAAAQAMLDLSKQVNSIGQQFIDDRNKVLSDTDAVMKIFEDQRTIAQKQLDALLEIQKSMREWQEAMDKFTGPRRRDAGVGRGDPDANLTVADLAPLVKNTEASVNLLSAGFQGLLDRLDELTRKTDENTTVTRNGFEGASL